jgi:hypothetical protein
MQTRKNTSRSKEIDIVINAFKDDINIFKEYVINNPFGGNFFKNNLFFKYGNIERLIDTINWKLDIFDTPIKDIIGIFHLDSISILEKKSIEKELNLQSGILTNKSKADILVLTKYDKYVLSFKDGTVASKLGQVSTEMRYNQAVLRGGLILPFSHPIETKDIEINQKLTGLSISQFEKLTYKDKYFAFIKKNHKELWNKYISETYQEAIEQLINFGIVLSKDKESLTHFILITLFGRVNVPQYYNLLINDKLILSDKITKFLKNSSYTIECEHYRTEKKFSLIIYIVFDGVKYGITKIEPAFDGARENVSQTKGIIFYFQQYPALENHLWHLLKNISK